VYRARDTRLNRDVAVKILAAAFARDPERMWRFQQEAQAVAALNHSNILAIHDFGEHEGSPYIVTEFLERNGGDDGTRTRGLCRDSEVFSRN
jgi:serine/threonine protein kinase